MLTTPPARQPAGPQTRLSRVLLEFRLRSAYLECGAARAVDAVSLGGFTSWSTSPARLAETRALQSPRHQVLQLTLCGTRGRPWAPADLADGPQRSRVAAVAAGPGSTRRIRLSQPFGYFVLYRPVLSLCVYNCPFCSNKRVENEVSGFFICKTGIRDYGQDEIQAYVICFNFAL